MKEFLFLWIKVPAEMHMAYCYVSYEQFTFWTNPKTKSNFGPQIKELLHLLKNKALLLPRKDQIYSN